MLVFMESDVSALRTELNESCLTVYVHRPEQRNAFTQQMWHQLTDVCVAVSEDARIRLVVIASDVPGVFSSGADMAEYRANGSDVLWMENSQAVVARAVQAVRDIPVPTIAALDGACFGGGVGVALACDFRLATGNTTFAVTPAKIGMVYPMPAAALLTDVVGPARARQLLFTARTFDAIEARGLGLVDDLASDRDSLAELVRTLSVTLLANSTVSIRLMKRMLALLSDAGQATAHEGEALVREGLRSRDYQEGLSAFFGRRSARFGPPE